MDAPNLVNPTFCLIIPLFCIYCFDVPSLKKQILFAAAYSPSNEIFLSWCLPHTL